MGRAEYRLHIGHTILGSRNLEEQETEEAFQSTRVYYRRFAARQVVASVLAAEKLRAFVYETDPEAK